jgi:2-methylcitrate dehydratase PrpD
MPGEALLPGNDHATVASGLAAGRAQCARRPGGPLLRRWRTRNTVGRMQQETATTRFCAAMRNAARFIPSGHPDYATVSSAARRTLVNVLGTAISAVGSDAVTIVRSVGGPDRAGDGEAATALRGVIPGLAGNAHPYWAALATGTAAHLDDFDDTHLATVIHPGASVLATVLAQALAIPAVPSGAGQASVSGDVLLGAFAAGCEAQLRIGNAISPAHYDRGWHITGTCGVFGAAVAATHLLGLDPDAMARALSLAAVMTAGHREAFGSMTKPLHAGKAAANGVLAARLAAAGLSGPRDPLGPGGVLEVLAGGAEHVDPAALFRPAADHGWELELNTFKTYPCGVVAHPAMDAAIEAFPRIADSSAITAVAVTCNPLVLELMGLVHPDDGLRARFSARHGIAAGLRYGRAGLAEFSDPVATDPEMTRLRNLISLNPDPGCARDAAVVRIGRSSGDPVEVRVEHSRGSVARPLTDADLLDKVDQLVAPVLGPSAAARIRGAIDALPRASDITGLLDVIRPAPETSVAAAEAGPAAATSASAGAAGDSAGRAAGPPSAPAAMEGVPTTDAVLALALAPPALADEAFVADQAAGAAKDSLARFNDAVTAGEGARVPQAIEAAAAIGILPGGHALTAFVRAASALAARSEADVSTTIVCAAATAVGENCAEAVAIGGAVTDLVAMGLPDAGAQGWSVPVVSAAIGATVAAGVMLGLPESQLRAAIGIAATQAAGLSSAAGTDAGPLQAGKAAFNAVEAALLAQRGFTSSPQPLEGRRGLYALFAK